ncbi:MAG: hypothetical protein ACREBK_03555 [Sphingomicrobium sp.]
MSNDPAADILNDPRFKGSPLTWEADPVEYDDIRHAWLTHVAHEERLFQPYSEAEWKVEMGAMLNLQWVIQFPWVRDQQKFSGEKVLSIRPLSPIETPAA